VRRHLGSQSRLKLMRQLAWWLWTDKKTRTFSAMEVPQEIIQQFRVPGISDDGMRRELLVGSIVEERNVGHFLSEKQAGIFYFPHTSFTEFLVADYILSSDFVTSDMKKVPGALHGEVPTFLKEHSPSAASILEVYKRLKSAKVSMTVECMNVLLNDYETRQYIRSIGSDGADAWDICLHYFLNKAEALDLNARHYLTDCLNSGKRASELAGMYCLVYEDGTSDLRTGVTIVRMFVHIFRRVGIADLISACHPGGTNVRSSEVNHLAKVVSQCIQVLGRESRVRFDFAEFIEVAKSFIGHSCVLDDIMEIHPQSIQRSGQ
jgi:hypothetical protein